MDKTGINQRIEIEWIDSWGVNPSWEDEEEALEHNICHVKTLGYLVKETKEAIWITMSKDERTKMLCGIMVIPKVCIIKRC